MKWSIQTNEGKFFFDFIGTKDKDFVKEVKAALKTKDVKQTLEAYRMKMLYYHFQHLSIDLNEKLQVSAGRACYGERKIQLNYRLLSENREEIKETVLHELAHFVTRCAYPKAKAHGDEFRAVLFDLGGNGETYHTMDIANTSQRKFKIYCRCRTWQVTKSKFEYTEAYKTWKCKVCETFYTTEDIRRE